MAQGNIALNLIGGYRVLGGGWELRLQPPRAGGAAEPRPCPGPEAVPSMKLVPQTKDAPGREGDRRSPPR